jgi:hypothetical protein
MDKYSDIIKIKIGDILVEQSVGRWFNVDGEFCPEVFESDFTKLMEKKSK